MISEQEFKLIYDAIVWAVRHLERNVAETGLNTLSELLVNVEKEGLTSEFHSKYFILVLEEVLAVLTDTLHKPGFAKQVEILSRLVGIVDRGDINVPIWKQENGMFQNNAHYVHVYITNLLGKAFPHVHRAQAEEIVRGMFVLYKDENKFKVHMRDFLIQLKEFSATDNSELFAEEQAMAQNQEHTQKVQVPGLVPPAEVEGGDRS
jgi:exportin-1